MIFHEQPTEEWSSFDFRLVEAYQILQDETCPSCGNPIWICRSTNDNVRFKIEKTTCFAEREYKMWEERKRKRKKDWEPDPGDQWYPLAVTIDGGLLPSREDYYKELAAKME